MRPGPNAERGFTLIELMIILLVEAVLAAVVFMTVRRTLASAQRAEALRTLRTVEQVVLAHERDTGQVCPSIKELVRARHLIRAVSYTHLTLPTNREV